MSTKKRSLLILLLSMTACSSTPKQQTTETKTPKTENPYLKISTYPKLYCGTWEYTDEHDYPNFIILQQRNKRVFLARNFNDQAGYDNTGHVYELTKEDADQGYSQFSFVCDPEKASDPFDTCNLNKKKDSKKNLYVRIFKKNNVPHVEAYEMQNGKITTPNFQLECNFKEVVNIDQTSD